MADAAVSKTVVARRVGSNPSWPTNKGVTLDLFDVKRFIANPIDGIIDFLIGWFARGTAIIGLLLVFYYIIIEIVSVYAEIY